MNLLKNRKALSTVVTTLIILVVSVLLATVVTFYAINVTTTRVQEESLFLTKTHIWFSTTNTTATGEAALMIINTGGRDAVIDKITVRGQESAWTDVFYNITTGSISDDLTFSTTLTDGGTVTVGGTAYTLNQGTANLDVTLRSGYTMILYIDDPDSISMSDIGLTISITVYTSNAPYYQAANVQATS